MFGTDMCKINLRPITNLVVSPLLIILVVSLSNVAQVNAPPSASNKWDVRVINAEEGTRANITQNSGGSFIGTPPSKQKWLAVHVRLKPPIPNYGVLVSKFSVSVSGSQTKYPLHGVSTETGKAPAFFTLIEHLGLLDSMGRPMFNVVKLDLTGNLDFLAEIHENRPEFVFLGKNSKSLALLFAVPSKAKFPYTLWIDDSGGISAPLEKSKN